MAASVVSLPAPWRACLAADNSPSSRTTRRSTSSLSSLRRPLVATLAWMATSRLASTSSTRCPAEPLLGSLLRRKSSPSGSMQEHLWQQHEKVSTPVSTWSGPRLDPPMQFAERACSHRARTQKLSSSTLQGTRRPVSRSQIDLHGNLAVSSSAASTTCEEG